MYDVEFLALCLNKFLLLNIVLISLNKTTIYLIYYRSMQYIHRDMNEDFLTLSSYPESMYKKVTLLKYFRDYMSEHLLKVIMLY